MTLRFIYIALVFLWSTCAWSAGDDGFGSASKINGKHFTIFYKAGVDPLHLIDQLKVSPADQMLTNLKVDTSSLEQRLASSIEILFNRAGDVLDMHAYSFKGNIKVFPSVMDLTDFYNRLYRTKLPCTGQAFYLVDFNSIYISADSFRREILGHEMGHAVMSHYFVVQPSVKVQEVLAGYVEYQLKKSQ